MNIINLAANGNNLSITNEPFSTSGGARFDECYFVLDASWYGFTKRAVFSVGDEAEYAVDVVNNSCLVPKECLEKDGILKIGLVGKKADGTIISTNLVAQKIQRGANQNKIVSFMGIFESPKEDLGDETPPEDDDSLIFDSDDEDYFGKSDNIGFSQWNGSSFSFDAIDLAQMPENQTMDLDDYLDVDFNFLAANYEIYVTRKQLDNDIYVYDFKPASYDRTVLITANHTGSSDMALRALGGFFRMLCERKNSDPNMNFLYNKVRFVVIPVACPYAFLNRTNVNINGVDISQGYCLDEEETETIISYLSSLSEEKTVFALDLSSCSDFSAGKKISLGSCADFSSILKQTKKFDCSKDDEDAYKSSIIIKDSKDSIVNYLSNTYGINSCSVAFNDEGYSDKDVVTFIEYISALVLCEAGENKLPKESSCSHFTKRIFWQSGGEENNTFALGLNMAQMWFSLYKKSLSGFFDITLSGYAVISSQNGATVTLRPVLYQENVDKFERFADSSFDITLTVPSGLSVVPLQSILSASFSSYCSENERYPSKIGAVICGKCADGDACISGFSYTLSGTPSNGTEYAEILIPQGFVYDCSEENEAPTFMVKNYNEEDLA